MSKSQADVEGERFKQARLRAGFTLAQLAQRLGYSAGTISAVENGHDRPSPRLRKTLIHGLLLNEGWLASGDGEMFSVPPEKWDVDPGTVAEPRATDVAPGFGTRLRWIRRSEELSLTAFAAKCDFDHSYISRLERGESRNPSRDFVDAVCRAFGVSDGWLVTGEGQPSEDFIQRLGEQRRDFPGLRSLTQEELHAVHLHIRDQLKAADGPLKLAYKDFFDRVWVELCHRVNRPWEEKQADR